MGPDVVHLSLPSDQMPWTSTGIQVAAGDHVSLFGSGFIRWSDEQEIGAGAKFHLWGRVRGGRTFNCTRDTTSTVADRSGTLEVGVYRGAWADRYGNLATGPGAYQRGFGALDVTVVRWPTGVTALEGLGTWPPPEIDQDVVDDEIDRLTSPASGVVGWSHLLDFGDTEIFRADLVDGAPSIEVVCDDDIGILTTPVRRALAPDTMLEWSWRVDTLPSAISEHRIWSYDYISIAVEFGDGRDLTWFWSAALAPVTDTFACPAGPWRNRETHMPVRSGPVGLGRWQVESRNVWDDVARFMGPPPERIVGVWLIGVSHFSRSRGHATFSDIRLIDSDGLAQVL